MPNLITTAGNLVSATGGALLIFALYNAAATMEASATGAMPVREIQAAGQFGLIAAAGFFCSLGGMLKGFGGATSDKDEELFSPAFWKSASVVFWLGAVAGKVFLGLTNQAASGVLCLSFMASVFAALAAGSAQHDRGPAAPAPAKV